jgi:exopolyphosphatase / guanosine-5'-triphosphate,3'-diphosphate pyrophosphatase
VTGPRGPEGAAGERIAAAIDAGSNSVHLLVARLEGTGLEGARMEPLADASVLLGLGEVVDREGRMGPEARDACVAALAGYVQVARAMGAVEVTLLGTEPFRRAADSERAREEVLSATGLPLHVLSHEAEAGLTLLGVLGGRPPAAPALVLDIGGGSTEVVLLTPGSEPLVGVLPTGSARLAASLIASDPPRDEEIEALRREAAFLVAGLPDGVPVMGTAVGGSGRNLALLTGGDVIARDALDVAFARIGALPAQELVARYGLRERRARQIAAGAALVEAVMRRYALPVLEVSDASLREGAVLAVATAGEGWLEALPALVSGR